MANRAYLLAVENKMTTVSKDPAYEILAEGINEVPVFWASLFVQEDRTMDSYQQEGGGRVDIPNWCVSTEVAQERLGRLATPIGRLLDEKSRSIWSKWVQHFSTIKSSFIKTNAAEVWSLDPKGYDKHWEDLLRFFGDPSMDRLATAVEANEMQFDKQRQAIHWQDSETIVCKLAGAPHIADVPWLRDLPPPDPPGAPDLNRQRQHDAIMDEAQQAALFDSLIDTMTPEEEAELERIQRQKRKMSVHVTGPTPLRLEAAVPCSHYASLHLQITPSFSGILKLQSEAPELNNRTISGSISWECSFPWSRGALEMVIEPIDPPTGGLIDIDYSFSGTP